MNALDRLLHGSIDMHIHPAPSLFGRLFDEVEAARFADEVGMRAIVVKSHHHSTASDAQLLRKYVLQDSKTELIGAIVLNTYVGGINPYAVDAALKYGARVVWFPTFSSERHISHTNRHFPTRPGVLPELPVQILDEKGDLVSAARQVIKLVAEADAALSPGHTSPAEVLAILRGAREVGVRRVVVNHPEFVIEATDEEIAQFCELGAYIEHSLAMYVKERPMEELLRWINLVGPDRTSFGSDTGGMGFAMPVEAYRVVLGRLLDMGVAEADIEKMVKRNPAWLLKLDG